MYLICRNEREFVFNSVSLDPGPAVGLQFIVGIYVLGKRSWLNLIRFWVTSLKNSMIKMYPTPVAAKHEHSQRLA